MVQRYCGTEGADFQYEAAYTDPETKHIVEVPDYVAADLAKMLRLQLDRLDWRIVG